MAGVVEELGRWRETDRVPACVLLTGGDVLAGAQAGSGKSLAFGPLPAVGSRDLAEAEDPGIGADVEVGPRKGR